MKWLVASILLCLDLGGASQAAETEAGAVKFYIMIDVPKRTDQLALDRWYLTHHSQEMHRAMRAWQRNYLSYRSYEATPEARRLGVWTGRLTEIHYDRLADFHEGRKNNAYLHLLTPPPGGWQKPIFRTEPVAIPVNPQDVWLEGATPPKPTPYFRWVMFLRYPQDVTAVQGDEWLLGTHVKEIAELPELKRYIGYRVVNPSAQYQRVVELWFDDYDAWHRTFVASPPRLTAPPWGGEFPFVEHVSTFVGENPDVDFINDRRVVP